MRRIPDARIASESARVAGSTSAARRPPEVISGEWMRQCSNPPAGEEADTGQHTASASFGRSNDGGTDGGMEPQCRCSRTDIQAGEREQNQAGDTARGLAAAQEKHRERDQARDGGHVSSIDGRSGGWQRTKQPQEPPWHRMQSFRGTGRASWRNSWRGWSESVRGAERGCVLVDWPRARRTHCCAVRSTTRRPTSCMPASRDAWAM